MFLRRPDAMIWAPIRRAAILYHSAPGESYHGPRRMARPVLAERETGPRR